MQLGVCGWRRPAGAASSGATLEAAAMAPKFVRASLESPAIDYLQLKTVHVHLAPTFPQEYNGYCCSVERGRRGGGGEKRRTMTSTT